MYDVQSLTTKIAFRLQAATAGFNSELLYGFICGSTASTAFVPNKSDIDIFICTTKPLSAQRIVEFQTVYFNLHEQFNAIPDLDYPGEFMDHKRLLEALTFAENSPKVKLIKESKLFDGIVWAGMLYGEKHIFNTNDSNALKEDIERAKSITSAWADALSLPKTLPADKQLAKILCYE